MLVDRLIVGGVAALTIGGLIAGCCQAQDEQAKLWHELVKPRSSLQRIKPANDEPLWQGQAEEFFDDSLALRLCQAIADRDQVQVKEILDAGNLDIHRRGKVDMTFVYWAYLQGNLPAFQLLLKQGASPDVPLAGELVLPPGVTRTKGFTVLMHACMNFIERPGFFTSGIGYTKQPNQVDNQGKTFLHWSVSHFMNGKDLRFLTEVIGVGVDLDARTRQGETACHIAVAYNPLGLLLLLKAGADPDIPLPDGRQLLDVVRHKEEVTDYPVRLAYGAVLKWLESRQLEQRARAELDID